MHKLLLFLLLSAFAPRLFAQETTDTTWLRTETAPLFLNYSNTSKLRLDSIQATVPLPYNAFVQDYIDTYITRNKGLIGKMLGLSEYYFPIFEKALKQFNIPEEIKYLTIVESAMDPLAISKSGAAGLWQFMPGTAKGYGLSIDKFEDQRKDPVRSSYAAANYLKDAFTELGDWLLAIAAYNCGTGDVRRAIAKAGSRDYWEIRKFLPAQTQRYIPAFIAVVYAMKCAANHQIIAQQHNFNFTADTMMVSRPVSLTALAKAADLDEALLLRLNPTYTGKMVYGSAGNLKRIILPVKEITYATVYKLLNEPGVPADLPDTSSNAVKKTGLSKKPTPVLATIHRVAEGQSLGQIAEKYQVTVKDLKTTNGLKGDTVSIGQELRIPSAVAAKQAKRS